MTDDPCGHIFRDDGNTLAQKANLIPEETVEATFADMIQTVAGFADPDGRRAWLSAQFLPAYPRNLSTYEVLG